MGGLLGVDHLARVGVERGGRQGDRQELAVAVGDRGASLGAGLLSCLRRLNERLDRPFRPVRRQRADDGREGEFPDHRQEQHRESERREHEAGAGLLHLCPPLQVGRRDADGFDPRHARAARGCPGAVGGGGGGGRFRGHRIRGRRVRGCGHGLDQFPFARPALYPRATMGTGGASAVRAMPMTEPVIGAGGSAGALRAMRGPASCPAGD